LQGQTIRGLLVLVSASKAEFRQSVMEDAVMQVPC
jgi:hypothetical protein